MCLNIFNWKKVFFPKKMLALATKCIWKHCVMGKADGRWIFSLFSSLAAYSLRVLSDISGYIGCLAAGMNRGAGREERGRARWQWFLSDKNIQFLAPVQTAAAAVVKEPAWLFIITSAQSCEEFTIHFTLCWCWYAELGGGNNISAW